MANIDRKWEFLTRWRQLAPGMTEPVGEYKFAQKIGRQWPFDWAWPEYRVAVEIDGGNRMVRKTKTGRHVAVGSHTQDSDYEKINAAQSLRWRVFRFTTSMLTNQPAECVEIVRRALDEETKAEET